MIAVVARVPQDYRGRALTVGEVFSVEAIEALVLHYQGKVRWARPGAVAPVLSTVPPDVPVEVPAVDELPEEAAASRPRRRYRRRDLVPED